MEAIAANWPVLSLDRQASLPEDHEQATLLATRHRPERRYGA
jgi:hypothetical protein